MTKMKGRKQETPRRSCEGEMAELRRRREAFIATVVHDFRGPLTSIMGFSQIMERALAKGKPCEPRQVEVISREARRLNEMVEELANMSLIEAGRLEVERQPSDIATIARKSVAEIQPATPSHELTVEAPDQPVTGNWDPGRLARLFRYLIDYAVKLSQEGGKVIARVEPEESRVSIGVSSQGPGIPEELLPLVFEPFSSFYREKRIKGMGMGLFISKGIVEAHGGHIWVESQPGKGVQFKLVLPLS